MMAELDEIRAQLAAAEARIERAKELAQIVDDAIGHLTMNVYNPNDVKQARRNLIECWPQLLAILEGDTQ